MPLGPSDVFIIVATVRAAMMLICAQKAIDKLRMFLEKSTQRGPSSTSGFKSVRVRTYLVGLESLDSLLLFLLAEDDEWATVFVECKTHCLCSVAEGT